MATNGNPAQQEAIAQILKIDSAIADYKDRVSALSKERAEIISAQGQLVATRSVGQEVTIPYGYGRNKKTRRFRITRIGGWLWSPQQIQDAQLGSGNGISEGEFQAVYYGRQVKVDGTMSDKEKRLWDYEMADWKPTV